jgi:hypothetical protein
MTTARVIDTHRLSVVAQEYERDLLRFFRELAGDNRGIELIRQEAVKVHFEEIRCSTPDRLLARIGSGKYAILFDADADAAGIAATVYAGKLIDELGMYDEFTLWVSASPQHQFQGPAWLHVLREAGVRPDCVVRAEPTNLCFQMREAPMEGLLSESHPLVQAAIATYESLFELPPILSQSPSPGGPVGVPVIAFGPGEGQPQVATRHLLKATEFYAAFPTVFADKMRERKAAVSSVSESAARGR